MDQLLKWLIFGVILIQCGMSIDLNGQARDLFEQMKYNKINGDPFLNYPVKLDFESLMSKTTEVDAFENMTAKCRTDIYKIQQAIVHKTLNKRDDFGDKILPLLVDASGRPMPGFLKGNTRLVGMTQQCASIKYNYTETARQFQGQYVRVSLNQGLMDYRNGCKPAYFWDVCVPISCTQPDLFVFFQALISAEPGYTPVCLVTRLNDDRDPFDYRSYITMGVMGGTFLLCLLASLYDAFILPNRPIPREPDSIAMACFRSFSSYTIIGEILSTSAGRKPGQIPQLHCLRFFSMCWVILGHTSNYFNQSFPFIVYNLVSALLLLTWNLSDVLEDLGTVAAQILVNSFYAVDTFFFQSGLLLSFLWFRAYNRNPERVNAMSSWIMFYVHRILRLSPAYFVAIVFYTFVFSHFTAQYPIFLGLGNVLGECKTKFWYNFLYINNIVGLENPCYLVSWYLATDMQMYIFAPVLILPFTYSITIGVSCSVIILVLSTLANFFTVLIYHFPPSDLNLGWKDPKMTVPFTEYTRLVYNAAWIRCQIYIIGFLLGYYLQRYPKGKINRVVNVIGWILCIGVFAAIIFPIRSWTLGHRMPLGYRAIFSALCRLGWGYILSFIIISCYYGYGGPINTFLSWNGWLPLGRLSYSAYLIHLMVDIQFMGFSQTGMVYTNLVQSFCVFAAPVILFTYLLALIWSSTFEVPFGKLEAILTTRLLGISHRAERPTQVAAR